MTLVQAICKPDAYLPLAATHSIGVGAAVFNPLGADFTGTRVAAPREEAGHTLSCQVAWWKLKEHFVDALEREVLEETGVVAAVWQGWFAMRHHHQGQFGASNLYICCPFNCQSAAH